MGKSQRRWHRDSKSKVELRNQDWAGSGRAQDQDKAPLPSLGRWTKGGHSPERWRLRTAWNKHWEGQIPTGPRSPLPTPCPVGKSRNPSSLLEAREVGGLPSGLEPPLSRNKQRGGGATSCRLWGLRLTPSQPLAPGNRGW